MENNKNVKKTISVNKTKAIKPAHYAATTSIVNKDAEAKEAHAKKHNLTKKSKVGLICALVAIPVVAGLLALILGFLIK